MSTSSLDSLDARGKTVLVRVDLNVPMQVGKITDTTRIERILPTIRLLAGKEARVVLLSHLGRPEGKFTPSLSLAPLVDELQRLLGDIPVRFGVDCLGDPAREAIVNTPPGTVLLLENLRFHPDEEQDGEQFAAGLAALGDVYVNEAFSCSHRAHASITGIPRYLPALPGLALEQELQVCERLLHNPERPVAAVVGGSKVSTKLDVLTHLVTHMDYLIVGGAMASTFLYSMGYEVGASLCEKDMASTAKEVMKQAKKSGCTVLLPEDVVVATALKKQAVSQIVPVDAIGRDRMILDIGPETLEKLGALLRSCKMLVWNGPLGAFETSPFDGATIHLARVAAKQTRLGRLQSIAGGGDTVAALSHAGLGEEFTWLSTAGGAFLEWLEGKPLPGVAALHLARRAA